MGQINNSSLLDTLIQKARGVGIRADGPITAERFLVCIIEESDQELLQMLTDAGLDLQSCKNRLLTYINNGEGNPLVDNIYMQNVLRQARSDAEKNNLAEITPKMVLQCILQAPSDIIKACLSSPKPAAGGGFNAQLLQSIQDQLSQRYAAAAKPAGTPDPVPDATPITGTRPRATAQESADSKKALEELTNRVKDIHDKLSATVLGQEHAVSVFTSGYFQAELLSLTDKKRTRPRATYLFAGPPGVGKTFLAETAAKVLDIPFTRFDMSEYCDKEAALEFIGSDAVYKNAKSGNFTEFVGKNPKCLVLFDEIEKAHISIIHLFLQILDAGRIRDSKTDREIPLRDVIMIFTTNAGKQLYENSASGDFSSLSRKVILKALQKDINPTTDQPYFPAAICSRFASGNVVMFNHMEAHTLCAIAKKEVLRQAGNFHTELGVNFDIDERVYTSLLFAEGGAADARTVRSRAEAFFDTELFELFRLSGSDLAQSSIADISTITMDVELPENDPEITGLFVSPEKPVVLVFGQEAVGQRCAAGFDGCEFLCTDSREQAVEYLREKDVQFVLLDILCGQRGESTYLNIEDVESDARDFFRYLRLHNANMPIFLLETQRKLGPEERVSFLRQGARDILSMEHKFADELRNICISIHQQTSMHNLARANKVVTFETAQTLTASGRVANIRLFDFRLEVAMDAEDAENILSAVSKPNVRFSQVFGAEDAKRELQYFVSYLKNPKKYMGTGVRPPKGVLLYGPPGTGKTMLAKAMASESDVTFITAEGNQFLKQYVGEGSEKVHELFRTARKYAPSILFIDEIDAIAKERTGEHNGAEQTLTAFLAEMDGFKNDPSRPVFVLAATNFNVEPGTGKSLDPAMMRRFDRRVYIDLPGRDDRIAYMMQKLASNPIYKVSEEKIKNLAMRSTGMSLAELESVFELSLRTVIREGTMEVTDNVLEEAFETFNSGEKKSWEISHLMHTARHEAGHAFLCWQSGEIPSYLTVVARANHGGYMRHADNEGKGTYTREELRARIRTSLGGRAAELVYYGDEEGVTTGASSDLANATHVAQSMICGYGMDNEFGLAVISHEARSGHMAEQVRAAVNKILDEEMKKAITLIRENRAAIDRLVDELIAKTHLSGPEIDAILKGE